MALVRKIRSINMRNTHLLTTNELLEFTFKNGKTITKSDAELLPVFSQEGKQLGVAPRLLCHRLGLIHKVVYLFISNTHREILVQIRGDSGRIDVPVGGHISIDDKSEKEALIREAFEELGVDVNEDKITYHQTYFRESESNIKKPEEANRELRVLYSLVMDVSDEKELNNKFSLRKDKEAVIDIKWMTIEEIVKYCDSSLVADGLKASLPHYLIQSRKTPA